MEDVDFLRYATIEISGKMESGWFLFDK